MAHIILHHNGAYNIFSSIVDVPLYSEALTLDELIEEIKTEHGESGMRQLPARLERAHKNGTSSLMGDESLEDFIICNRAGENETELNATHFIDKYMTLKPTAKSS